MAEQRIEHLEEALRLCAAGCDIAIQDQQERIQQLEEALKPFSLLAEIFDPACSGYLPDEHRVLVTLGMCRHARATLSSSTSEAPEKEEEQQYPWWEDGYVSGEAPEKDEE